MGRLAIRYVPEFRGAEEGKLWFDLSTDQFSGSGFFWSDLGEMPDLVRKLAEFPIGERSTWKWGYDSKDGDDLVLALSLAPADTLGGLEMTIQIANLNDTSQRVIAKLKPDYATLDRFRTELKALRAYEPGEALLEAQ